jgi:isopenicillin-N epimerase
MSSWPSRKLAGLPTIALARSTFFLKRNIAHINHGGVGATPRKINDARHRYQILLEKMGGRFVEDELFPRLRNATIALAKFIGQDGDGLVFMPSATEAIGTVISNIPVISGRQIIISEFSYPSVKEIVSAKASVSGAHVFEIKHDFCQGSVLLERSDVLINKYRQALEKATAFVVIDHMCTRTGAVAPLAMLVRLCHERGVPVLVDGAAAPGAIPIDLKTVVPEFYVGTAYKWLFAPKGSAFLWTAPEWRDRIRPLIFNKAPDIGFQESFARMGSCDRAQFLVIPDAIDVWKRLGGETLYNWNRQMVAAASEMLSCWWGSRSWSNDTPLGPMNLIELPEYYNGVDRASLQKKLYYDCGVDTRILSLKGRNWVRISAQIYNTPSDYRKLARCMCVRGQLSRS